MICLLLFSELSLWKEVKNSNRTLRNSLPFWVLVKNKGWRGNGGINWRKKETKRSIRNEVRKKRGRDNRKKSERTLLLGDSRWRMVPTPDPTEGLEKSRNWRRRCFTPTVNYFSLNFVWYISSRITSGPCINFKFYS